MRPTLSQSDLMQKIVSLCKRRLCFQSSEIYGGLKSSYDYGPLGVELKRNIAAEWWRSMVTEREDIVGLDASIVMRKSGKHQVTLQGFLTLLWTAGIVKKISGCKAPKVEPNSPIVYREGGRPDGKSLKERRPIEVTCARVWQL